MSQAPREARESRFHERQNSFWPSSALADARGELERLGARRNAVEAMLAGARSGVERDTRPVDQVVEEAMAVLAEDSAALLTLAAAPLHNLVSKLIVDGKVDMATKDVTVAVALPTWTLAPKPKSKKRLRTSKKPASEDTETLCQTESLRSPSDCRTQQGDRRDVVDLKPEALPVVKVLLAKVLCQDLHRRGSHGPACYECRRLSGPRLLQ